MSFTLQEPTASIAPTSDDSTCAVEIVLPVYNEENDLVPGVQRLHAYLETQFPFSYRITIADNASTDNTWDLAQLLSEALSNVQAVHLEQKGRGRALQQTWMASSATVVAYMDIDLSTDLAALLPLVAPLLSGHSDVSIGTRLTRSSKVARGLKREVISRCYNLLLRTALHVGFSDAQCGFKAMRTDRAKELLPLVEDKAWFFDTEVLVLSERSGLRIHEVPVDWIDDPDSRVDIVSTAKEDLRGMARLSRNLLAHRVPLEQITTDHRSKLKSGPLSLQLISFAAIGCVSTLAYMALFMTLRQMINVQLANVIALLATTFCNTVANRRLTFGMPGKTTSLRTHLEGYAIFAMALGLTSGTLAVLHALHPESGALFDLFAVTAANLAATVLRFTLFRTWVFHPRRRQQAVDGQIEMSESNGF